MFESEQQLEQLGISIKITAFMGNICLAFGKKQSTTSEKASEALEKRHRLNKHLYTMEKKKAFVFLVEEDFSALIKGFLNKLW